MGSSFFNFEISGSWFVITSFFQLGSAVLFDFYVWELWISGPLEYGSQLKLHFSSIFFISVCLLCLLAVAYDIMPLFLIEVNVSWIFFPGEREGECYFSESSLNISLSCILSFTLTFSLDFAYKYGLLFVLFAVEPRLKIVS